MSPSLPTKGSFCTYAHSGFTLVELIATIAILAAIVALSLPFIANYITQARQTADRQTLEVLNSAINRYKTQGGSLNALTAGKPQNRLLLALQTPVNWTGLSHQFLRDNFYVPEGVTLAAAGSGSTYRLTQYGSYIAEVGGSEVPVLVVYPPMDKTGLDSYYEFNDNQDAHSNNIDLQEYGTPTYSSGYASSYISTSSYFYRDQGGISSSGETRSYALRFRPRIVTGTQNLLNRVERDQIILVGNELRANIYAWMLGSNYLSYSGISANTWYSVCITRNGTTGEQNLYVNGALVDSGILSDAGSSTGGFGIGSRTGGEDSYADADFANASIWTRELTAEEAARLHNNGNDLDYADL